MGVASTASMTKAATFHRCFMRRKERGVKLLVSSSRTNPWPCRRLSTASDHQDPTLRWAQTNPDLAQQCLNPPPPHEFQWMDSTFPHGQMQSLEGYLKWRRWTIPQDASAFEEEAVSLASHVLSTPLTLAYYMHELRKHGHGDSLYRWCCIGARAEASLPSLYWKEFLLLGSALKLQSHTRDENIESVIGDIVLDVKLDFVGPDIPPRTVKQEISISCGRGDDGNAISSAISLQSHHRGLFHEYSDMALMS
jgi:hypothetical protein